MCVLSASFDPFFAPSPPPEQNMRHLDRFDVFEHPSFKKRYALANYPARRRLFSKMLRDYTSKGTQTRKIMGCWKEHGKELGITRRTLGRWVVAGVTMYEDWVKSVDTGSSALPAKRIRVEGDSPSPAKKMSVRPAAAARDLHAPIMADASSEMCTSLMVAEQEIGQVLPGRCRLRSEHNKEVPEGESNVGTMHQATLTEVGPLEPRATTDAQKHAP